MSSADNCNRTPQEVFRHQSCQDKTADVLLLYSHTRLLTAQRETWARCTLSCRRSWSWAVLWWSKTCPALSCKHRSCSVSLYLSTEKNIIEQPAFPIAAEARPMTLGDCLLKMKPNKDYCSYLYKDSVTTKSQSLFFFLLKYGWFTMLSWFVVQQVT